MAEPTLLVVPGSYSSFLAYYDFRDSLKKLKPSLPDVVFNDLPSASSGPPLPPPTLYDDAVSFSNKIAKLADDGRDIVLFAHSYGGGVAREASRGLSKHERTEQGKPGGIVRIIFLTAVIPEAGQSTAQSLEGHLDFDFLLPYEEGSNDYMRHNVAKSAPIVFSDLPEREAVKYAAFLTIHSAISFANPVSELSAYDKAIPSTYIFCSKDKCLLPRYQRERIAYLKRQSGDEKVQVVEIDAGHAPNVSQPENLAKIVASLLDG